MTVPQYQLSFSKRVGRNGTLLRIRPTSHKHLAFSRGTVITVPYTGVRDNLRCCKPPCIL